MYNYHQMQEISRKLGAIFYLLKTGEAPRPAVLGVNATITDNASTLKAQGEEREPDNPVALQSRRVMAVSTSPQIRRGRNADKKAILTRKEILAGERLRIR